MQEKGAGTAEGLEAIQREVRLLLEEVVEYALCSPWPEPEEALEALYAD